MLGFIKNKFKLCSNYNARLIHMADNRLIKIEKKNYRINIVHFMYIRGVEKFCSERAAHALISYDQ